MQNLAHRGGVPRDLCQMRVYFHPQAKKLAIVFDYRQNYQ